MATYLHFMKKLISLCLTGSFVLSISLPGKAQEMMSGENPVATKGAQTRSQPASSSTKPLSRAEEILKRFDKDRDGRLDEDEKADAHDVMLQEQMAKEAPPPAAQGLAYFQELALELFDRNHDGRIDEPERAEATGFVERGDATATRETLSNRFDRNRDGKLDDFERRESEAYVVEHRGELLKEILLKRFDANGNGQLEPEEKTALRAALMSAPTLPMEVERAAQPTSAAKKPGSKS
ncbi:MAG: hypothetical protein ABIZ81_09850 [Opitutaceae bacterium]